MRQATGEGAVDGRSLSARQLASPATGHDGWRAQAWQLPLLGGVTLALYVAVLPGHWLDVGVHRESFLALHTLLEMAAVLVCLTVGLTANYTLGDATGRRAPVLTTAFLLIAALDLLHLASYAGMPDLFSPNTPHKSILLWLLARLVAALSLLAWAAGWQLRQGRMGALWLGLAGLLFVIVCALAAQAVVAPQQLPAMFVPGQGLTPLKKGLELGIAGLNLLALVLHARRRRGDGRQGGDTELRLALWLAALGEGFFVLFSERSTDMANMTGHLYKLLSYALLYRCMFIDRVRRPFIEAELREAKYRNLLELAPDGVVVTDREGQILIVNRALEQMFGRRREDLVGQGMELLLPPALRERHLAHRARYMDSPGWPAMRGRDGLRGLHADGHEFDIEVALGLDDGGEQPRLTAYVSDISERRAHERELQYRATHDALTGLPNRWLFADRLAAAASGGRALMLLVLDLDGFHAVNEFQGTPAGDSLLRACAAALLPVLPEGATLARLGSDEFAILCDMVTTPELLASRLQTVLLELGTGAGQTACFGLLLEPAPRELSPTELLGRAQLALQSAKALGKGQVQRYTEQLGERSRRDALLEQRLRLALQQGTLDLHYQPQVGVPDGRVLGFEALLRWDDMQLGMVSPALFVPVAERAGLMGEIGAWVLQRACAQLRNWRDQGFETVVAINLSPLQFRDAALAEQVLQTLGRHALPSCSLVVEITESAVMDDPAEAARQLQRLQDAGIAVHLDDFGTGHSSLAWLRSFPIQVIKIDRSFVRDMLRKDSDDAIVRAVIGLAHTLGCRVIAEGVEEQPQLERLSALGCDEYQGWLFSPALPPDAARLRA
ncbi:EAL domain-containing protein [Roseateles microcysteis]|uniref:bifunctional diguanylate cyclase/phosphodiesterase n=1 Tax=Roseateles microcysteis TaxID=3119057 RepID=UPI002FE69CF3